MNGLISLWKGSVTSQTSNGYTYYVPLLPNWYVCDGSQITDDFTTPNLVGYIPVGATSTNIVNTSGGNFSISEEIPVTNHIHNVTLSSSSEIINSISINNYTTPLSDENFVMFSFNPSSYVNASNLTHNHNVSTLLSGPTYLYPNITSSTTGTSNKLNYVSQYYIIYYETLSLTIPLFRGMIYNWIGNVTTTGDIQPVNSSNIPYANWYVCCAANSHLSVPSFDDRIGIILTNGSISSSDDLSIREPINIYEHTHNSETSSSNIYTINNDTSYNSLNNVTINSYSPTTSFSQGPQPISNITHTHTLNYTYSYLNTTQPTTDTYTDPVLKYINLYYIIYLP